MKKFVLSLGGSIIVPDEVRSSFLAEFRDLILGYVDQGYEFVIFTGGGMVARLYQQGAGELGLDNDHKDWLGIHASRLNAQLVQRMFGGKAASDIIIDPTLPIQTDKPVTIGAGWKPGWSTDYDAVEVAGRNGFDVVVNLSNITYAYDKDPNQHDDAQKLVDTTWAEFQQVVGDTWTPGMNAPFDPIASKLAAEHGLTVIIANGNELNNLRNIIEQKDFIGTTIHA